LIGSEKSFEKNEIIQKIDVIENKLKSLVSIENKKHGGIGHNQPPEDLPFEAGDYESLVSTLKAVRAEAILETPDKSVLEAAESHLFNLAQKICVWALKKADLTAEEFAKKLGRTLADGKIWLGTWLTISGQISELVEALKHWLP
jgi:hypothetical protein